MADLFPKIKSGAEFSPCGNYRYQLWRIWDETKPKVAFIGLNPSTANEETNDPTIRRVISFANKWGYGGVIMYNLFAIVSSSPEVLLKCGDPMGNNQWYLDDIKTHCERIIFAWGSFKEAKQRAKEVAEQYPDSYCLKHTKNGEPWHPLYVKGDAQPILFQPEILTFK